MALPARPDEDGLPTPRGDDPPSLLVWAIAGCALVLTYIAVLALLAPTG